MIGNSGGSLSMSGVFLMVVISGAIAVFGYLVFRGPKDRDEEGQK
jgi:hypothetical protein